MLPIFNMYSLLNIIEVPRIANYLSPTPFYQVNHISFDGEEIYASNRMSVNCLMPPEKLDRNSMLFWLAVGVRKDTQTVNYFHG